MPDLKGPAYTRLLLGLTVALCSIGLGVHAQSATGTIKGHVTLAGKEPGNPLIRMGVDPKCADLNRGARVFQQSALVGADGSVANVFVRLEGKFPQTPVPSDPVVVDQRACVYGPRVVGMRVGQTLRVRNDDDLLHNVHSSSAVGNRFNVGQPQAGIAYDFKPAHEEVMLQLGCDVHRWMTAYVGVMSHPYFAVTGAAGTFEISRVPPGTYTIKVWHERFGERTQSVIVKPGGATVTNFVYQAS